MGAALSDLEKEVVGIFVRIAGVLSLPRSVGELYGVLFVSSTPLCMDDLMQKLEISKGSTSQGLKILRSFGAVNPVYVPGDRRDFFAAEAELRKIVAGFVKEQVYPHLEAGKERMAHLESLLEQEPPERKEFIAERIDRLKGWQKRAGMFLPVALNLIKSD